MKKKTIIVIFAVVLVFASVLFAFYMRFGETKSETEDYDNAVTDWLIEHFQEADAFRIDISYKAQFFPPADENDKINGTATEIVYNLRAYINKENKTVKLELNEISMTDYEINDMQADEPTKHPSFPIAEKTILPGKKTLYEDECIYLEFSDSSIKVYKKDESGVYQVNLCENAEFTKALSKLIFITDAAAFNAPADVSKVRNEVAGQESSSYIISRRRLSSDIFFEPFRLYYDKELDEGDGITYLSFEYYFKDGNMYSITPENHMHIYATPYKWLSCAYPIIMGEEFPLSYNGLTLSCDKIVFNTAMSDYFRPFELPKED